MNVKEIKNNYINYIKENTKFSIHNNEIYSVHTPFVDSFGEGISFSIKKEGKLYKVSDDGFSFWELDISGIDLKRKSKRKQLFDSAIDFNGFQLSHDNSIYRMVAYKDIPQAIHDMTQLLINIYDLTYLSRSNVSYQFYQDVDNYFMNNDNYAVFSEFNLTGKSQLNHKFNYVFLQKGVNKLARVHNRIDKQQVESILTSWLDTTSARKKNEQLYIVLSEDGFNNINDNNLIALESYEIKLLNFSDKNSLLESLGA